VKLKSLALICCLFFLNFGSQSASAACVPSTASGFATGSAVSGNQVLVCASQTQQNSSVSTSKPVASTKTTTTSSGKPQTVNPKINCPAQVRTTEQIVAATLAGCPIVGPSAPPARVVTVKPGKPAISEPRVTSSSQNAEAALSPRSLAISASQTVLRVGEGVVLTSDAGEHEKTAVILGRLGFVRFTPVDFEWLVDGVQRSPVAVTSFSIEGSQPISLQVVYLASTRFSLSEPWAPVGSVIASANIVLTVESVEPAKRPRLTPRLVSASCETKPSNYRC
jgi:hypothetical protein